MNPLPFKLPLILDGATGTMLQAAGMPQGVCPEQWVLENPEVLVSFQAAYVAAGTNILIAPTFGANRVKLSMFGLEDRIAQMNGELVALSRRAAGGKALVAGDLSPLGLFIEPFGEATFDDLYEAYREQAAALESAGVDLYILETFMTVAEARAALLAVRDVSGKPVFVSFTCDENGKTLTGTDVMAAMTIVQGMGASAFGLNCSTGPDAMLPVMKRLAPYALIPLIIKPNAGLPSMENGKTVFKLDPQDFCALTPEFLKIGVSVFGGCCGTTPAHIRMLSDTVKACEWIQTPSGEHTKEQLLAASEKAAHFIDATVDIGDSIDCSPDLAEELLDAEDDGRSVIKLALKNEDDLSLFKENQYMITKPLCLVSDSAELLEAALRVYNGRAIYDSTRDIPEEILDELSKRYGLVRL